MTSVHVDSPRPSASAPGAKPTSVGVIAPTTGVHTEMGRKLPRAFRAACDMIAESLKDELHPLSRATSTSRSIAEEVFDVDRESAYWANVHEYEMKAGVQADTLLSQFRYCNCHDPLDHSDCQRLVFKTPAPWRIYFPHDGPYAERTLAPLANPPTPATSAACLALMLFHMETQMDLTLPLLRAEFSQLVDYALSRIQFTPMSVPVTALHLFDLLTADVVATKHRPSGSIQFPSTSPGRQTSSPILCASGDMTRVVHPQPMSDTSPVEGARDPPPVDDAADEREFVWIPDGGTIATTPGLIRYLLGTPECYPAQLKGDNAGIFRHNGVDTDCASPVEIRARLGVVAAALVFLSMDLRDELYTSGMVRALSTSLGITSIAHVSNVMSMIIGWLVDLDGSRVCFDRLMVFEEQLLWYIHKTRYHPRDCDVHAMKLVFWTACFEHKTRLVDVHRAARLSIETVIMRDMKKRPSDDFPHVRACPTLDTLTREDVCTGIPLAFAKLAERAVTGLDVGHIRTRIMYGGDTRAFFRCWRDIIWSLFRCFGPEWHEAIGVSRWPFRLLAELRTPGSVAFRAVSQFLREVVTASHLSCAPFIPSIAERFKTQPEEEEEEETIVEDEGVVV
jgi:hypothetical protein